jgi:hypothetical protein
MAGLFVTYAGKKYEQQFAHGVPQFIDQRGNVVAGSTAKELARRLPNMGVIAGEERA